MAAITDTEKKKAARLLGIEIFVRPNRVARFGFTELQAIIQEIDDKMDGLASALTQNQSLEVNLHNGMQALDLGSGVSALSIAEESIAIQIWAEVKHGSAVL